MATREEREAAIKKAAALVRSRRCPWLRQAGASSLVKPKPRTESEACDARDS